MYPQPDHHLLWFAGRGVDSLESDIDEEMRLDAASYGLFCKSVSAARSASILRS